MEGNMIQNGTVTIFNRHRTGTGDIWYATIIKGIYLNTDKAGIIKKYGAESGDSAVLHVPCITKGADIFVTEKKYLSPKRWNAQQDEELTKSLTFAAGKAFDFFIAGEWDGELIIPDNKYPNGLYDYLNREYDDVFSVSSAARYGLIPHFEILGK